MAEEKPWLVEVRVMCLIRMSIAVKGIMGIRRLASRRRIPSCSRKLAPQLIAMHTMIPQVFLPVQGLIMLFPSAHPGIKTQNMGNCKIGSYLKGVIFSLLITWGGIIFGRKSHVTSRDQFSSEM